MSYNMMYLINKNVTIFILETEVLNYPKSCLKKLNVIKTYSKWMSQGLIFHKNFSRIDVKGINAAQPIWSSSCPLQGLKQAKTKQKCYFCLFYTLCRIAWGPFRLSHIDAYHINLSYWPKNQSLKFFQKILRIGG